MAILLALILKAAVERGYKLDANVPLAVDVKLDVGANTETVNVVASSARIQTESAVVGALVEEAQVKNMMLNGRNPVLLAALKAGVRSNASLANFNFNLTDGGFSMNGSRQSGSISHARLNGQHPKSQIRRKRQSRKKHLRKPPKPNPSPHHSPKPASVVDEQTLDPVPQPQIF